MQLFKIYYEKDKEITLKASKKDASTDPLSSDTTPESSIPNGNNDISKEAKTEIEDVLVKVRYCIIALISPI